MSDKMRKIAPEIKQESESSWLGKPIDDISAMREKHKMNLEDQDEAHRRALEARIAKFGFILVASILGACFIISVISAQFGNNDLFAKFVELSSTSVALILGYLFGSKNK